MDPIVEELSESESLSLVAEAGIGRIGFNGMFGPVVLPVTYRMLDGTVVFRTREGSSLSEDLRTGIADAEYKVAFEIDDIDASSRTGWSVLIQGGARNVEDEAERARMGTISVEPWVGGERFAYVRITPTRVTGRRIRRPAGRPAS